MLIITIKQGKEKSLLSGDPWIYLSAIDKVEGRPQERSKLGATAVVQSSARQFLARAAYNAKSQIAARVWTLREDEPVDHAMIKRRVQAAVARRVMAVRNAEGLPVIWRALAGEEPPQRLMVRDGHRLLPTDIRTGFVYPR